MATWTNIPDQVLEPGKPIRSVDALALRDNPIAIAQGAPGAPKQRGNGMGETNQELQWLLRMIATGTAQAGTGYIVKQAYDTGPSLSQTHVTGSNPAELRTSSSPSTFHGTVLVPGTYRIDLTVGRTSGGGSGATRVNILKNGDIAASSPYRATGTAEDFTVTFAQGDSIGLSVQGQGSNDRSRSITVTRVLIRTTSNNRGLIV